MRISSAAFGADGPIPRQYTGDGRDLSPPLAWTNVPDGARELALICDDPDAPREEPWVHWLLYKLPPDTRTLPEGVPAAPTVASLGNARQGKNSFGHLGYGGPAPPKGHGVHHYHFKLYALDTGLHLSPELDKQALLTAMKGHILAEAEVIGTYER